MPRTLTSLYRGTPTTTYTNFYTAPGATGNYAIIKQIVICSTSAQEARITLMPANVPIFFRYPILPYASEIIHCSIVLPNGTSIGGNVEVASTVTLAIDGVVFT